MTEMRATLPLDEDLDREIRKMYEEPAIVGGRGDVVTLQASRLQVLSQRSLIVAINEFSRDAAKGSRKIERLTIWLIALTVVLALLAAPPAIREIIEIAGWFK